MVRVLTIILMIFTSLQQFEKSKKVKAEAAGVIYLSLTIKAVSVCLCVACLSVTSFCIKHLEW